MSGAAPRSIGAGQAHPRHAYPPRVCQPPHVLSCAGGTIGGLSIRQRLRILHIAKRFWPYTGGIERYVEDLAVEQSRRGDRVAVLTIDRDVVGGVPGSLPAADHHRGIRVVRVPAAGSARKQVPIGRFGTLVKTLRWPDVIHHHDPRFLFETAMVLRRMTGKPLLFHTHGLIMHTPKYQRLKEHLLRHYYPHAFAHGVDWVIADSDADLTLLSEISGRRPRRATVIRNAIELSRQFAIPNRTEPNLILCFGRVDRHKGLGDLFRAVSGMERPWRLEIIGQGQPDLVTELTQLATELGIRDRVAWRGHVGESELDDALSRATVVAFPSEFEGFGLALLEAMAAGRPVVANDIPSHREILAAGFEDRLVRFADPSTAGQSLASTLAMPPAERQLLAAALRDRARAFGVGPMVDSIEELYSSLGIGH